MSAPKPYSAAEFALAMSAFAPFETEPRIALALSGGGDSMALMFLLRDWLRSRQGRLLALIVNHGLRPEAATEAEVTAKRCQEAGVACRILDWQGAKPSSGLQAAARDARYALLEAACLHEGIFHLAVAQHLDDQAETFLLRLERASRLHGLAAMAPQNFTRHLRIIRPLLDVPRERLRAFLKARDASWIDDPSNRDRRFMRVRMRGLLQDLGPQSAQRFADASKSLARERTALDGKIAAVLAESFYLDPLGYGLLRRASFLAAERQLRQAAMGKILTGLGPRFPGPSADALEALDAKISTPGFKGATLSGLHVLPGKECFIIRRELRSLPCAPIEPGGFLRWDGRFDVSLAKRQLGACDGPLGVAALGRNGWTLICDRKPELRNQNLKPAIAQALPALWSDSGLISQPHLGYHGDEVRLARAFRASFFPKRPVGQLFMLV